jgi:CDP-2,3-bis-(O-geranylgeranyl)-sn-glycerol synthase
MGLNYPDVVSALIFIIPAYCANAAPVILGGGRPLDGGRLFLDGKPILGSHKTVRGLISGVLLGSLAALILNLLLEYSILLGVLTSIGALMGDLVEAFFKRRLSLKPGESLPLADQLDFVLGALAFSFLVSPPTPLTFLIVILITPPIHLLTNFFAYKLGLKDNPW